MKATLISPFFPYTGKVFCTMLPHQRGKKKEEKNEWRKSFILLKERTEKASLVKPRLQK